jgi:hypothetical protein
MERTLTPEQIAAKKEQREREGQANLARYLEQQQQTLNKTERLRGLRLAAQARDQSSRKVKQQPPNPDEVEPHRPLPGLHQGIRGWS